MHSLLYLDRLGNSQNGSDHITKLGLFWYYELANATELGKFYVLAMENLLQQNSTYLDKEKASFHEEYENGSRDDPGSAGVGVLVRIADAVGALEDAELWAELRLVEPIRD